MNLERALIKIISSLMLSEKHLTLLALKRRIHRFLFNVTRMAFISVVGKRGSEREGGLVVV